MQTKPPGPRLRLPLALALALAIAATALARPPIAFAGTFTVHSCTTPTGTWTGMDGWSSASSRAVQGEDFGVAEGCTQERPALSLRFGGTQLPVGPGRWVQWTFAPPSPLSIRSVDVRRSLWLAWPVRAGAHGRPYVYDAWHDDDVPGNQLEFHYPPWDDDTADVDFPPSLRSEGVSWGTLNLRLRCWELMGDLDCGSFPASVTIPRVEIGVGDDVGPDGTVTGGALAGLGPVRGKAGLAFAATDVGAGVYRVALAVDGMERVRTVIDGNGGACADVEPGNDDSYEFAGPQPCPSSVDGVVSLDTTSLVDGRHAVTVAIEDAAGNHETIFDGEVQTHNAPISTGAPTVSGAVRVGGRLTATAGQWDGAPTGYDYRWLRCDANGAACQPVAGASGAAYDLGAADAYRRMRVEVVAANGSGTATVRSAPSAVVADASGRSTPPQDGGSPGKDDRPPGGIQGLVNPLAAEPSGTPNGTGASARARISVSIRRAGGRSTSHVRSRHGHRWTIVGRLTDASGAGIGDARVGVAWKRTGRRWSAQPGVRTRADGRFAYVLPPGPSRAVRFTYFAFSDSRGVVLSNVVRVDVRVPVAIRVAPRHVSGDRVVRLAGRVGGGTLHRRGAIVTLQGFQHGWGWRTFRTVRTDRRGRWSTRYRFRTPSGRFGFRALVPQQRGVPFAASQSKAVYVTVS